MIGARSKNSPFLKAISLCLVLTFSLFNISYAVTEDIVQPKLEGIQNIVTVDDIGVAIDCGTIKTRHSGENGKVIVHIQDAHCNYEAQMNINRMLEQLTKECGIDIISVEGAEGIVDTAWFKAFPDAEIRKEVATYFMKKGEITGAEYFSINSDYDGTIFGAETRDYYVKNLKAFTDVYPYKEMMEKYFLNTREVANRLKSIVYHPALREVDSKIRAFEGKEIELSEYADYLQKAARKYKVNVKEHVNFKKLTETLEYEKKIDFDIVDQERSTYIDVISKKLSKEEMTELVTQSIKFKKGHIKAVEFYTYLRELAKTHDIPIIREYPNLFYYYIYTKLYDGIDNEGLFREIALVEKSLKERLFKDDNQRTLDKYSSMLDMFIDLVNIELTNEDYELFNSYSKEFGLEDVLAFMMKLSDRYNLNYSIGRVPAQINDNIPNMIDFYEIAMKRDNALINNTLSQMKREGKEKCVLIAGGFHTKGIKNILERQGISYVVVTPKITKDVETPYIKVLTNQRTSLEDIITESAAMPGTGIAAAREEIMRPKEKMLAPVNLVFLINEYLNRPDSVKDLLRAIDAEGETEEEFQKIVSAFVRSWLKHAKEGADPEVWEDAKAKWEQVMAGYIKKCEDLAAAQGKVLSERVKQAIIREFRTIFTPGTEAVRLNADNDLYEGLNGYQYEGVDKVIRGLMEAGEYESLRVRVAAKKRDPETGKVEIIADGEAQMRVVRLKGLWEAIDRYNAEIEKDRSLTAEQKHERKIPKDLVVHPGTYGGRLYSMYLDERDFNALDGDQLQRLANHEFYHILNPEVDEKTACDDMEDLIDRYLMDIRAAFAAARKQAKEEKIKVHRGNLKDLKKVVADSSGVTQVLAITNGGDGSIVQTLLKKIRSLIFRKDGKVKIAAHEEVTRRGQFLGLLDAMRNYGKFDKKKVSLGIMMPGKGTRMAPLTQSANGIKPLLEMLIRSDNKSEWLSGATASLYTWNLVAYYLQEMGFRGMAWKWGDEPQIASLPLKALVDSGIDMADTDIVRFGSKVLVTDDLAENKEWLNAEENGNFIAQVRRRERADLLKALGVEDTPDAKAMVHIGSPAFSYVFIEEAMKLFGTEDVLDEKGNVLFEGVPQSSWLDVDGYVIEALTLKRDADLTPAERAKGIRTWDSEMRAERKKLEEQGKDGLTGMEEVLENCPDFYERCQELKKRINIKRGRPENADLEIKVVNFGEDLYWGDIGQLAKARATLYQVAEDTPEGVFARELAALDGIERDKWGNIVAGDCVYPQDGSVRNSVLVDTRIYGKADIDGAVLVNSRLGDAKIGRESVVFGSDVLFLTMGERAFSYNSVKERLDIPRMQVHTNMPVDVKDAAKGLEDWRAEMEREVEEDGKIVIKSVNTGSAENYKQPRWGNPRSFEKQLDRMRQRDVSPQDIAKAVDKQFRKPLEERMKAMAERYKTAKPLKFGTSGLRDQVENMTDMECYINTRGFIQFLKERGEMAGDRTVIAVGGDLRFSTPRIMAAVIKAIEDEGCSVDFCGRVPSPTLAYYAIQNGIPSVMVTGSHIPDDRNGIKFTKQSGEVLKTDEADILRNVANARGQVYANAPKEDIFDKNGKFKTAVELPEAKYEAEAIDMYVKRYTDVFTGEPLKGLRVALYQHSAVGRDIIQRIFTELGAEVIPFNRSDKFVPVDTEKVSDQTRKILKDVARENKPDVIISMDGDTDRPLLADENGDFLTGDMLGALVSQFLNPDFSAIPISANDGAVSMLKERGIKTVQTKIGSPYVIAAMNEELAENPKEKVVSWESNGGFLLGSDWEINGKILKALPTRDAALPLMCAMMLARQQKKTMSELIDTALPHRYTYADVIDDTAPGCEKYTAAMGKEIIKMFSPSNADIQQVDFSMEGMTAHYPKGEKVKLTGYTSPGAQPEPLELAAIREKLSKYFSKQRGFGEIVSINFIDGIRMVFDNGEVSHIRPSGNAPEFRNYACADSEARAKEIVDKRLEIVPEIVADMTQGPKTVGAQALRLRPGEGTPASRIVNAILEGKPVYLKPYREPKVWGVDGIGEYFYGAEAGPKSSTAVVGSDEAPMADVMRYAPEEVKGQGAAANFGDVLPLVKILTPKGRLSVQFHDAKNELWVVTGIDESLAGRNPSLILGFSQESVDKYGDKVTEEYGKALKAYGEVLNKLMTALEEAGRTDLLDREKDVYEAFMQFLQESATTEDEPFKETLNRRTEAVDEYIDVLNKLEWFYNYRPVKVGDVIPIASGTLHALTPGIEVVEPQIAGPTQSLEDGATYPVRYYFPGHEKPGAKKQLDIDRVNEMNPTVAEDVAPEVIEEAAGVKVERLPGNFEDKGLEVHRITLKDNTGMEFGDITSFHNLVVVEGKAVVIIDGVEYQVPKASPDGEMLIIPATVGSFKVVAEQGAQVIDTFTPVPETREVPVDRGPEVAATDVPVSEERVVFAEYPNMVSTFDQVIILDKIPGLKILDGRQHELVVQEGKVRISKADGTPVAELEKGETYTMHAGYDEYNIEKISDESAAVKVDYKKSEPEKAVYATYDLVRKHLAEIKAGQVDLILPEEMFVPGGKNTPGSAQWEQEQLRRYVSDKIRITTYSAAMGLKEAARKSINEGAVGILVATKSNINDADRDDPEVRDFLYGKKGKVRVLAIPDIDKEKDLQDKGWYFNREVEGTALLLSAVTPEQIGDLVRNGHVDNAAADLKKLMGQLIGETFPPQFLYYLMARDEIGDALDKLPAELQQDPFGWLRFLVQNLLLKMPIKPYTDEALKQLRNRRKIMWSV